MPPFREGSVEVDPLFSGDLLKELRDVGHGHRINIVDASYDIPRGSRVIDYPGNTSEALLGIVRLIPIEGEAINQVQIDTMDIDDSARVEVGNDEDHILVRAWYEFADVFDQLCEEGVGETDAGQGVGETRTEVDWTGYESRRRYETSQVHGEEIGFYHLANNPETPHFFVKTIDDLPFACASLVVGHSQLRK